MSARRYQHFNTIRACCFKLQNENANHDDHLCMNVLMKGHKSKSLDRKKHCINVPCRKSFQSWIFFNVYFPEDLADIHPALCLFRMVNSHINLSSPCQLVITPLTFSSQTLCHLHERPCCQSAKKKKPLSEKECWDTRENTWQV